MLNLIYNEMLKMMRKKRFLVVLLILIVLIPIFTYAQQKSVQDTIKQMGTSNWRLLLQQQIIDQQNRLTSSQLPEDWKKLVKLRIQQNQYYLDHNINPTAPGAPTFMRKFVEESIAFLLPLLVVVLAADLVSSEHSQGTIKLLLTRPVRRWKILMSKYLSLLLCISLLLILTAGLCYTISGLVFGYQGWNLPIFIGFESNGDQLNTEHIHLIPQWMYLFMAYGLAWFVCVAVGTIAFMISVLIRNTASAMGVMLTAIITGSLLVQMAPTWTAIKYFAFTHLKLTNYLSGQPMMVEGMSLPLSLSVLSIWSIVSLIIAFLVFIRRDVLQ